MKDLERQGKARRAEVDRASTAPGKRSTPAAGRVRMREVGKGVVHGSTDRAHHFRPSPPAERRIPWCFEASEPAEFAALLRALTALGEGVIETSWGSTHHQPPRVGPERLMAASTSPATAPAHETKFSSPQSSLLKTSFRRRGIHSPRPDPTSASNHPAAHPIQRRAIARVRTSEIRLQVKQLAKKISLQNSDVASHNPHKQNGRNMRIGQGVRLSLDGKFALFLSFLLFGKRCPDLSKIYPLAGCGGPVIIGGTRSFIGAIGVGAAAAPNAYGLSNQFCTGIFRSHACSTYRQLGPTSTWCIALVHRLWKRLLFVH